MLLIVIFLDSCVAVLGYGLCMSWSKALHGTWPGRAVRSVLMKVFLGVWLFGIVSYVFFKYR